MSVRVFLAVELDVSVREALACLQDQLRSKLPRIAWVRPQSIHLTVKFLGDVEEAQVQPIRQGVTDAVEGCPSFFTQVERLGVFPHLRVPRVLWLGLTGDIAKLQSLVTAVDQALLPLGFQPESRPFSPHLTLARIKERARDVGQALEKSQILEQSISCGGLTVDRVCLFKSDLKPSGAVYTKLWEAPLGSC